jgi:hypothetical protein
MISGGKRILDFLFPSISLFSLIFELLKRVLHRWVTREEFEKQQVLGKVSRLTSPQSPENINFLVMFVMSSVMAKLSKSSKNKKPIPSTSIFLQAATMPAERSREPAIISCTYLPTYLPFRSFPASLQ